MKKLGLLTVGVFFFVACDSTPKGNKAIYPVTYDEIAEDVDHSAHKNQEANTVTSDSVSTADVVETTPAGAPAPEALDSVQ